MSNKNPTPIYKENKADKLKYDMGYMIIGCFLIYLFCRMFEFIFKPLQMLSKEEVNKRFEENIYEKRFARQVRTFDDPCDPMNQFRVRIIEKDPQYKRDKENNKIYYEWFQAWQDGKIIDSDLRWAPDIMDENSTLRPNFIQYMKIQYFLHKKAGPIKRALFLNTIYKFYPELTASMRGLANDLANYQEENHEIKAERELRSEIQKYGLPIELANYLANKDINAKTLGEEAQILKGYTEAGHPPEACICVLENKFNDTTFESIELILKYELPTKVAVAYIKGELTTDELGELSEGMYYMLDSYGIQAYDIIPGRNKTAYDDILDSYLEEYKRNKVTGILNRRIFS